MNLRVTRVTVSRSTPGSFTRRLLDMSEAASHRELGLARLHSAACRSRRSAARLSRLESATRQTLDPWCLRSKCYRALTAMPQNSVTHERSPGGAACSSSSQRRRWHRIRKSRPRRASDGQACERPGSPEPGALAPRCPGGPRGGLADTRIVDRHESVAWNVVERGHNAERGVSAPPGDSRKGAAWSATV